MREIHPQERLTADLGRRGVCLRHQCIYILQIWEVSVLLRESRARGGRRRETPCLNSQQGFRAVQLSHARYDIWMLHGISDHYRAADSHMLPNRSLSRWQSERHANCAVCTTDAAKSKVSDNRFLNLSISNYCIRMIWHRILRKYQYARTQTDRKWKKHRLFIPSEGRWSLL